MPTSGGLSTLGLAQGCDNKELLLRSLELQEKLPFHMQEGRGPGGPEKKPAHLCLAEYSWGCGSWGVHPVQVPSPTATASWAEQSITCGSSHCPRALPAV